MTTKEAELQESFSKIDLQLQEITNLVSNVDSKQEEIGADVRKIKEALYNPENGIFTRIIKVESWKTNTSRLMWILVTGAVGLTSAAFWNLVIK